MGASMAWHTRELSSGRNLIESDHGLVIGCLNRVNGRWQVEIMWSGPFGDYKFDGRSYTEALAFIEGVEQAQRRCAPHLNEFPPLGLMPQQSDGARYFLKTDYADSWSEVTRAAWIECERRAGFRPAMSRDHPDYMDTTATGGFSAGRHSGKIEYGPKPA